MGGTATSSVDHKPYFAAATPQGAPPKIAFVSRRDGSAQVYLMNTDGTGQTRLSANTTNDESPRWSPDNSRILFQSDRDNPFCQQAEIYVMNADGSGQTRLTNDVNDDSAPVWSPDGTKIAFQSMRNGVNYQVYMMNADGSGQVNISNSAANDIQPSWSPDGTKLSFASDRDQAGFSSIYVMNANGSSQTRLTFSGSGLRDEQPVWSPDGTKLAFVSTRDSIVETWQETDDEGAILTRSRVNTNKEIYLMNADGSAQVRLTNTLENDDSPAWSPDGTKIVFRSERDRDCCDPTEQVWVMNFDGSSQVDLSNNVFSDCGPSWQRIGNNASPTVNLTSPANGASFTAPANITITATASDSDGTINRVDFYQGTILLGTDTSAPYSFNWSNLAAGSYSLTAKATDNGGAVTTSNVVNITVNTANQPPAAHRGGPYSGSAGTAIQFDGNGSFDPDGWIASYSWNFGDGGTGFGATPSHTYAIAGTYTVTLTVADNVGATNSATATVPISSVTNNGYAFRRHITIDHNKVPNTDQSNFPVLISGTYAYLATAANNGNVQNANGYDVIFTSDPGCTTKLDHEVETYNAATGAVNYWVRLPAVSHLTDTVFYMCYSKSGITTDQSNRTAVWDTNFKGVWHLPNGSTLSAADSTANANVGGIFGPTATTGKIDGGSSSVNAADHINAGSGGSLNITGSLTIAAWIKMNTFGVGGRSPIVGTLSSATAGYALLAGDGGGASKFIGFAPTSNGNITVRHNVVDVGAWYHVVVVSNGVNPTFYVNGANVGTGSAIVSNPSAGSLYLGNYFTLVKGFDGIMDEVRVSNAQRSADWIATEYNNQSSPATFYSISAANAGSNQPPLANAGGPYFGIVGTAINFNGSSSSDPDGWIVSFAWNFGDGGSGSGPTPLHTYATGGTYTATLTVTDNSGAQAGTSAAVMIATPTPTPTPTPNQPPIANPGSPYSGTTGNAVSFNGSGSSDPDGSISSYAWNFGDGTNGTGVSPTHIYASPGTYTVTLTVTDNNGAPASATTTATISAPSIPTDGHASLSYDTTTNRITTAGFAYDAAGNQVRALIPGSSNSQRFQYDAANRLVNVKSDDNLITIASYTYGDSNERLILEEAGVRTYYACDGSAEYTETGGSITPQWSKTYIYLGARLLSTLTPNGSGGQFVQYHHPDRLGTRLVTNAQDTNYFEQQTLPFGTALNESPPAGAVTGSTNKRFTTYDRSLNTGLDYAVNRHYDPQQGRFTQVDPIGMDAASPNDPQSLNMYSYCGNDPINQVDPEGLFFGKLLKWIGKALKILSIVALVVMTLIIFAPASSFAFKAALWMFFKVLLPLSQVPVLGAFVPLGSLGSPQWNPQSRGPFGNSYQDQGSNCPPDCQEQITLPPVSAGTIYANYSVWERTWRGLNIGLDKGLTTVVGFADFITYGGSKKASKEFARVLGGDAAAKDWTRDNSEREGSWFHTGGQGLGLAWDVATGGSLVAARFGWKATFNIYKHGGFGVNIVRNGVRRFAIDWHKYEVAGKWVRRIHGHWGKTKSQMKKHRPLWPF